MSGTDVPPSSDNAPKPIRIPRSPPSTVCEACFFPSLSKPAREHSLSNCALYGHLLLERCALVALSRLQKQRVVHAQRHVPSLLSLR